jgi:hypothetical protein
MNIKLFVRKVVLFSAVLVMAGPVRGNTFGYTNGNVLICFRKNPSGATDLIVNAGPISYFTNLAANTTVTVSGYTGTQLGQVGTNSIDWSAWAYFDTTAIPALTNTIYMTSARSDLNTQTDPYYRDTASAQGTTINKLLSIVNGANDNGNYSGLNSSTAVLESESYNVNNNSVSYAIGLGVPLSQYNFRGTFQGDPEQSTGASFTTGATPVRADFYWIKPTANTDHSKPAATFLGYFQFATNGVMTYTAYPTPAVVTPTIVSFTRIGTTSTVTFITGNSGTYTLRGTNSLTSGTARTNWPAISSVGGDGNNHSLQDTTSSGNKFYIITAQ